MPVTSNFSFFNSVFKRLVLQTVKNQGLFGKGLTKPFLQKRFKMSEEGSLSKHSWKGGKWLQPVYSPSPTCYLLSKRPIPSFEPQLLFVIKTSLTLLIDIWHIYLHERRKYLKGRKTILSEQNHKISMNFEHAPFSIVFLEALSECP